jgi:hypothetical protein
MLWVLWYSNEVTVDALTKSKLESLENSLALKRVFVRYVSHEIR